MDNVKVSVIILTYNNLQYIDTAVSSVLSQDYPEIEVIVHDDCSKEFNKKVIQDKFKDANWLQVQVESNPCNLGTVRNFNEALKLATGDIIVPLSCDDSFYDERVISEIVNTFKTKKCLICSGLRQGIQSGTIAPGLDTIKLFEKSTREVQLARIFYSSIFCGATLYYNKELLEKFKGFDERFILLEDYPFVLEVLLNDIDIEFMSSVTILYNETGISQKKTKKSSINPKLREDFKKVYELIIFPNLDRISFGKMKKYLKYRYYKNYFALNKVATLFYMIKYWDIVFIKLKNVVLNKFLRKSVTEFDELLK